MKYSIIIPAYNAERTLPRCLDSIVGQLPSDAELILIDDGSNDGTGEICRTYAVRNSRIRFLTKPNGGVSSARNMGLDYAAGEYVLFVDSDDAVSEAYFERLNAALRDSPDLLLFSKQLIDEADRRHVKQESFAHRSEVRQTDRNLSRCFRRQELNLITTKAFRRDIIEANRLRFDERLDIGEDKVFAFAFTLFSSRVIKIMDPLYYLSVDGQESLSRKKRDDLCESVLLEHRIMSDMLESADVSEKRRKLFRNALYYSFYRSAYTVSGELRKYDYSSSERRTGIREILESYSNEEGYAPKEPYCRFISIPIRKKQAYLVDAAMKFFYKRGER